MTAQQARVESLKNQMLVNLDARLDDIERLAEEAPLDTRDEKIVAMVLFFTAGMLKERRGLAALLAEEVN